MPGIPTQFTVLEQTLKRLQAAPPGSPLSKIGAVITGNPEYAYFGAVGATIGDFIPAGPGVLPQYVKVWQAVFDLMGGWGTPGHPGLYAIINTLQTVLAKISAAAAAEDKDQLQALQSEGQDFTDKTNALANLFNELQTRGLRILGRIGASGPAVNVPAGAAVPGTDTWSTRDVLHWRKTGKFAQALIKAAGSDPRFLAYAYGYLISYSVKACGSPFVNSIVLGPYRTQWWRHRWVNNWVDAWVYGSYGASAQMAGDTPTPGYETWPGLCNANLQKRMELPDIDPIGLMSLLPKQSVETDDYRQQQQPFPSVLPADFGQFWMQAYTQTYGAPAADSPVKAEELNGAYLMTWLMLWFQTSALGCNTAPPPPPDNCNKPDWVDAASAPGSNGATVPPAPDPANYENSDTLDVICGILLALLGVAVFVAGGMLAGAAAIAGGIALASTQDVDWTKLRCDLYWYQVYMHNGLDTLHQVFCIAGLVPPYSAELGVDEAALNVAGFNRPPYLSGKNLCRSQARREGFPAKIWVPSIADPANWVVAPTAWEAPQTIAYLTTAYPSFFVDDAVNNPLSRGSVLTAGTWPPGYAQQPASQLPVQFGNAVDNAVELLSHLDANFPDWNLDADRGLASMAWQFQGGVYGDPVAIAQEP